MKGGFLKEFQEFQNNLYLDKQIHYNRHSLTVSHWLTGEKSSATKFLKNSRWRVKSFDKDVEKVTKIKSWPLDQSNQRFPLWLQHRPAKVDSRFWENNILNPANGIQLLSGKQCRDLLSGMWLWSSSKKFWTTCERLVSAGSSWSHHGNLASSPRSGWSAPKSSSRPRTWSSAQLTRPASEPAIICTRHVRDLEPTILTSCW